MINPLKSLPVNDELNSSAVMYPGDMPGVGNSILGPRVPRVSSRVTPSGTTPPSAMGSSSAINPNAEYALRDAVVSCEV
jgi:hypothetical protein